MNHGKVRVRGGAWITGRLIYWRGLGLGGGCTDHGKINLLARARARARVKVRVRVRVSVRVRVPHQRNARHARQLRLTAQTPATLWLSIGTACRWPRQSARRACTWSLSINIQTLSYIPTALPRTHSIYVQITFVCHRFSASREERHMSPLP